MNDLKIERYLNKLEKELGVIPALKKSEIILETKTYIQSKLENGELLDSTLSQLGRADQLGQKYLRDLGYIRKEKSSFGKYFFMTILIFILILFVGAGAIVWKFSPIISIDEQTGRFQFLGGMIDIQAGANGDVFMKSPDSVEFSSQVSMVNPEIKQIDIKLKNGFLKLQSHSGDKLIYQCKADEDMSHLVKLESSRVLFDWGTKNLSCSLTIPEKKSMSLTMNNGSVSLNSLEASIDLKMKAGTVTIEPGASLYNYHLAVTKGTIDQFDNSNAPEAYKVKVEVERGRVSKK